MNTDDVNGDTIKRQKSDIRDDAAVAAAARDETENADDDELESVTVNLNRNRCNFLSNLHKEQSAFLVNFSRFLPDLRYLCGGSFFKEEDNEF